MSIKAVDWALKQKIPARPKLVLVAIANHANNETGYCWLRADTIAREASCSVRSVFRYLDLLELNRFARRQQRRRDDGRQRANDYWIFLNRKPAPWDPGETSNDADETAEMTDSSAETKGELDTSKCADSLSGIEGQVTPESLSQSDNRGACGSQAEPVLSPGPCDSGVTHNNSAEPSRSNPKKESSDLNPARRYQPLPPVLEPMGATLRDNPNVIFVFRDTPAYDAWKKYKQATAGHPGWNLQRTETINGRLRFGWFFPTLFPPDPAPCREVNSLTTSDSEFANE